MNRQTHLDCQKPVTIEDLEHMASCDFCIEQFADYVEKQALIQAPAYLDKEIRKKSRQFDVQIIAKSNQAAKRLQLFYYGLKVSFAAAFAITFLMLAPSYSDPALPSRLLGPVAQGMEAKASFHLYDSARKITDRWNDITEQIFKTEVISHDK